MAVEDPPFIKKEDLFYLILLVEVPLEDEATSLFEAGLKLWLFCEEDLITGACRLGLVISEEGTWSLIEPMDAPLIFPFIEDLSSIEPTDYPTVDPN